MTIGFRDSEEDRNLIARLQHEGESTTDVLRRALRALDRQTWEAQARADMERLRDEDLSNEPDDWGGEPGTPSAPAATTPPDAARTPWIAESTWNLTAGHPALNAVSSLPSATFVGIECALEDVFDVERMGNYPGPRGTADLFSAPAIMLFTVRDRSMLLGWTRAVRKADVEADHYLFFKTHALGGNAE